MTTSQDGGREARPDPEPGAGGAHPAGGEAVSAPFATEWARGPSAPEGLAGPGPYVVDWALR